MDGKNGKKVIVYNTRDGKKEGGTRKRLRKKERERKRGKVKN